MLCNDASGELQSFGRGIVVDDAHVGPASQEILWGQGKFVTDPVDELGADDRRLRTRPYIPQGRDATIGEDSPVLGSVHGDELLDDLPVKHARVTLTGVVEQRGRAGGCPWQARPVRPARAYGTVQAPADPIHGALRDVACGGQFLRDGGEQPRHPIVRVVNDTVAL